MESMSSVVSWGDWEAVAGDLRRDSRTRWDPSLPTSAPAGSREKVEILAARVAAGLPLWHPDDSIRLVDPPDEEEPWCSEWPDDEDGWVDL